MNGLVFKLLCTWLEKTGRIKNPARGTPERTELVDAFRAYYIKISKAAKKP